MTTPEVVAKLVAVTGEIERTSVRMFVVTQAFVTAAQNGNVAETASLRERMHVLIDVLLDSIEGVFAFARSKKEKP